MLNLSSSELKIIRVWAEQAESSPFPQEIGLLKRVKGGVFRPNMSFTDKELDVILHWADQETKGHHGTERYLLEHEAQLIEKIEKYLENTESGFL